MDGLKWAMGCVVAIALQVQPASAQLVYPGLCERTSLSAETQAYCDRILGLSGDELAQETARENERRRIAQSPERAGYFDTVWPSEHTDLWRSHAVLDAGLPADFDPRRLNVSAVGLNLPVWGYTRRHDEVFVIGGSPVALDTFTRAYKLSRPLDEHEFASLFLGSLLNPSIPYVAKVRPNGMQLTGQQYLTEGSTVNYTGGLLMHQNGFVYAVSQSVLYKISPYSMRIVDSLVLPKVGDTMIEHFWTTYNGMQVLASGQIVLKGYHFLNANGPGWLLLVDPDDLAIDVQQQADILSARLTIEQTLDQGTWLYHSNATQSLRFEITRGAFVLDEAWTRPYRENGDGTTQASSPVFFGQLGQIVFADSTLPSPTQRFHLYTQPVDEPAPPGQLLRTPAFRQDVPGFNFFMIAGDPFLHQIVVYYDPINNLLSAHDVGADGTLERRWERDIYKVSASPAISPDRDLLYIDDYRDDHDEFVILRLSTGEELARVALDATLPTIGTIFLGMNDDVYIISSETGGTNGLVSRVHLRPG
jgi:hypothetical protein